MVTYAHLCQIDFERYLAAGESSLTDSSAEDYKRNVGRFVAFCDKHPAEMDPISMVEVSAVYFQSARWAKYSLNTRYAHRCAVKFFFDWLHRLGELPESPEMGIDGPSIVPRGLAGVLYTRKEIELLFWAPFIHDDSELIDYAVLALTYYCMYKISDLTKLKLSDICLADDRYSVRAGSSDSKTILIPESRKQHLRRYMSVDRIDGDGEDSDSVFVSQRRARFTRQGLWLRFQKFIRRTGLRPITHEQIRESRIVHLHHEGFAVDQIAHMGGYKDPDNVKMILSRFVTGGPSKYRSFT